MVRQRHLMQAKNVPSILYSGEKHFLKCSFARAFFF